MKSELSDCTGDVRAHRHAYTPVLYARWFIVPLSDSEEKKKRSELPPVVQAYTARQRYKGKTVAWFDLLKFRGAREDNPHDRRPSIWDPRPLLP